MKLFFIHVLGVRPECLENRRRARRAPPRDWCTDGVAASACAPGIFGPILAFRGEIEAQGRGSLHPHLLVWLIGMSASVLLAILQRDPSQFKTRVARWMKACVVAMEGIAQSSVRALPRQFAQVDATAPPLPFTKTERGLTRFDGGSEVDVLREEKREGALSLQRK